MRPWKTEERSRELFNTVMKHMSTLVEEESFVPGNLWTDSKAWKNWLVEMESPNVYFVVTPLDFQCLDEPTTNVMTAERYALLVSFLGYLFSLIDLSVECRKRESVHYSTYRTCTWLEAVFLTLRDDFFAVYLTSLKRLAISLVKIRVWKEWVDQPISMLYFCFPLKFMGREQWTRFRTKLIQGFDVNKTSVVQYVDGNRRKSLSVLTLSFSLQSVHNVVLGMQRQR